MKKGRIEVERLHLSDQEVFNIKKILEAANTNPNRNGVAESLLRTLNNPRFIGLEIVQREEAQDR